jgi:hypothetical protein
MMGLLMNWKRFGRKRLQPNRSYYPRILLEGLRKTTKTVGVLAETRADNLLNTNL